MSADGPTLLDILVPPENPWLLRVSSGTIGTLPVGIRIVRHQEREEAEDPPQRSAKKRALGGQAAANDPQARTIERAAP